MNIKSNSTNSQKKNISALWKRKDGLRANIEREEIKSLEESLCHLGEMDPQKIKSFAMLPLSKKTQKGLIQSKFVEATKVQSHSLILSLRGLDVVVAAKTGSGKTLAFLIPLLELLYRKMWSYIDGLGAIVITPTRELAYQIFEVLNKIGKNHSFSVGLVIGGKDLKFEWHRVSKCNIMICTPGRLLQHITENPEFTAENVQLLVLDEADQCLSLGFADAMNTILYNLPKERQTLLFSATQTRDVNDLIRAGCQNPVFCSVHEHSKYITPNKLKESYIICDDNEKITFLWSFLKHHKKQKILVFLATCKQVKYIFDLFTHLRPGLCVMGLRGDMHQLRRMAVYDDFCRKKKAVLFATDVAARGLDIPCVDWVIQLDCPEDTVTYVHRVGRTARHTMTGESLLVLTPFQESPMLGLLKTKNISPEKIDIDPRKLQNVSLKIEAALSRLIYMKEEAVRAFKAYLKSIAVMRNKKVFDAASVNVDTFARSLGLVVTPRVRFIERKIQAVGELGRPSSGEDRLTTLKLVSDEDEENDEDFLVSARKGESFAGRSEPTEDDVASSLHSQEQKRKVLTKYQVVKKLLKKKVSLNTRTTFDEEGHPILDPDKDMLPENCGAALKDDGLDIAKMKEILRAEDRIDKRRQQDRMKEKRKRLKEKEKLEREGSEDDSTECLVSELPDPDRIYGEQRTQLEEVKLKSQKQAFRGKVRARQGAREAKRMKLAARNDLAALQLAEKEDIALFLLTGGASAN